MALIRILEIPAATGRFHFDGGEPQLWLEVDWFRDDGAEDIGPPGSVEWKELLTRHVQMKRYYSQKRAYLILHPDHTFTLNYAAP